jgi:hypothetical protein
MYRDLTEQESLLADLEQELLATLREMVIKEEALKVQEVRVMMENLRSSVHYNDDLGPSHRVQEFLEQRREVYLSKLNPQPGD